MKSSYSINEKTSKTIFISFFIAIFFTYLDTILETTYGIKIKDRSGYLFHFQNIDYELSLLIKNFSYISFFNESLYYPFLYFLDKIYFFGLKSIDKIIFITTFTFSFYIIRYAKLNIFTKIIILIFCEIIITNYTNALRQGFASSFFLVGFFSRNKYLKVFLFIVATQIHYLFFIPLILMFFIYILKKLNISPNKKNFQIFFILLIIIFFLTLNYLENILLLNMSLYNNYSANIAELNFNLLQVFIFVLFISIYFLNAFDQNTFSVLLIMLFYLFFSVFLSPVSRVPMALGPLILIESSYAIKRNKHISFIWLLYCLYMIINLFLNQNLNNISN